MDLSLYLPQIEEIIERALEEDVAQGDITTNLLISPHIKANAKIISKTNGILAGIEIAKMVFHQVDPFLKLSATLKDGSSIKLHDIILTVEGSANSILKGERTVLNFLQHLSGIATKTSLYVTAVKGLPVKILDTRKTVPGIRILQKYAVTVGGGYNHRQNLGEMVLIKDNHLAVLRKQDMHLTRIIEKARKAAPAGTKIEIETTTVTDALQAVESGADIVMLDNMSMAAMHQAVMMINHRAIIEASGGVNLDNIREIAETGVDWISVGALTHSVNALDISLEIEY